jgi:hypothetical protein
MNKNNFDQSSTGVNIELSAHYDGDLSRHYFDDAFFEVSGQLVYCEGNFSEFEKEFTFTKKELESAYIDQCTNWGRSELLSEYLSYTSASYSKATKQELIDFVQAQLYYRADWIKFCEKAGFKGNFDTVESRGYSQGDYKEVIVPHKFWEAIGRKKYDMRETIDRLIWDSPIYCRLTVNDVEFYIDQELKDGYQWDKNEALEIAKRLVPDDIVIDWLTKNLPENLEYV